MAAPGHARARQPSGEMLRALLVEPSVGIADALVARLRAEGFDVQSRRASDERSFVAGLDGTAWNVILCAHEMGGFGAVAALEILRRRHLEIPLVSTSATLTEDAMIGAMAAGARDVICTTNLARLAPVIRREMKAGTSAKNRARSRERLISTFMDAVVGLVIIRPELGMTDVNDAFCTMTGYSAEELVGRRFYELASDADRPRVMKQRRDGLEGRLDQDTAEFRLLRKDGETIWCIVSVRNVRRADGKLNYALIQCQDVTRLKKVEAGLRASEERYRSLVDLLPDAVLIHGKDDRVVFANNAAAKLFGASSTENLIGVPAADLLPESKRSLFLRRRNMVVDGTMTAFRAESKRLRLDGTEVDVEISAVPYTWEGVPAALSLLRDISDRKDAETERTSLEQKLRQAQKMEAVGVLAGGIAHDFNNLLVPMGSLAELTMERLPEGSRDRANLERVVSASRRAKDLIRKILSFSRQDMPQREAVRLEDIIQEAFHLLRATLPTTIELRYGANVTDACVLADVTQIQQVLLNLGKNAADAIDMKTGVIDISLDAVDVDEGHARAASNLRPGHYYRLRVRDTGCGMDERTVQRIFEPFFTTKAVGKGTGMGLSVALGIVTAHGGGVAVTSTINVGTCIDLYFPPFVDEDAPVAPTVLANEARLPA